MKPETACLHAHQLSKGFPGVQALDQVDITFDYGKVTALMGENGAGKSTLLKILNGDYQPDSGRVLIRGEEVHFGSPLDSRRAGLRVVMQEPDIVPFVSVAENMYLGALPGKGIVQRRELRKRAQAAVEQFGFERMLSVDTIGYKLSPAQRQLVEILRCLIDNPEIILLDEPTSSLSDSETDVLFGLIQRLAAEGKAVGYVSHRLAEIFTIADRVTVLRDGKLVGTREIAETTPDEVVRLMVGRDLTNMHDRERRPIDGNPVVLDLQNVTTDDVTDVSFQVRSGEIVALSGLVGAGRSELALAVAGDRPIRSGEVRIDGKPAHLKQPKDAIALGIGLAPEERKADALVLIRSVRENVSLAILDRLSRWTFIRERAERELTRSYVEQLNIRTPGIDVRVEGLSGGNQQKVVLARWLAREANLLILDEPTRGVDVGAKAEIYTIIDQLAAQGAAILVISSELPEALGLADRIIVMQNGRITGELSHAEATEEKILALAMASEFEALEGQQTHVG
ncbi:MAG: sugar ABC transporter ATP-binding protein [Propionicimonas sp.]